MQRACLHGEGEHDGAAAVAGGLLAARLRPLRSGAGGHGVLAAHAVAEDELRDDVCSGQVQKVRVYVTRGCLAQRG